MNTPQVVVLGIDGACSAILNAWMAAGELPNLERLMARGVHGNLQSSLPPYSATAWVSFATGKGPGKHGVFDFWRLTDDKTKVLVDSTAVRGSTLWSLLSRHGVSAGVVNVPMTYPPSEVEGIMISGMLTPNESVDYTYPRELKEELIRAVGDYAANPYVSVNQRVDFLQQVAHWEQLREQANQYLLERYDFKFFVNVVQGLDPIQHQFWKQLDRGHPNFDPLEAAAMQPWLLQCYATVDDIVGSRLRLVDEGATLFVVSDHGFGPTHKYFNVNRFLAELGLLVFEKPPAVGTLAQERQALLTARITAAKMLRRLARQLDVLDLRTRLLNNRQREAVRARLDRAGAPAVDWAQTRAYYGGVTGQCIYVNLAGRDPHGVVQPGPEYEALRDRIIAALEALRDPDTGDKVIEAAYRKEDIYSGPCLDQLPDIVFDMGKQPYSPVEALSATQVIEPLPAEAGGGRHQQDGILLAAGPNLRSGSTVHNARLIDIAPTILYALGLPVPVDMDGRVLLDLFNAEYAAHHPVHYDEEVSENLTRSERVYRDDEARQVEQRLRQLGYLD